MNPPNLTSRGTDFPHITSGPKIIGVDPDSTHPAACVISVDRADAPKDPADPPRAAMLVGGGSRKAAIPLATLPGVLAFLCEVGELDPVAIGARLVASVRATESGASGGAASESTPRTVAAHGSACGLLVAIEGQTSRGKWAHDVEGVRRCRYVWEIASELVGVRVIVPSPQRWQALPAIRNALTSKPRGSMKPYHAAALDADIGVVNEDQAAAYWIARWALSQSIRR